MPLMFGEESGFTTTENVCVALKLGVPLSETISVKLLVEFAWVTSGRKLNAPLLVFSVALVAPTSSAKVSVWGGESASVALAVKATVWPTFTVRLVMADLIQRVRAAGVVAVAGINGGDEVRAGGQRAVGDHGGSAA